jgi:hypothetical protein
MEALINFGASILYYYMETKIYSPDNAKELVGNITSGDVPSYLQYYYEKISKELQVHTQGKLYDKTITVFENEEPEASKFVLSTYESVTKGSIWRGIDNLSRIFNNTGFDINGDTNAIKSLGASNFFENYINEFVNTTNAIDPNTVQVWIKENNMWHSEFIQTQFIKVINENEIAFILPEDSEYEIQVDRTVIGSNTNYYAGGNNLIIGNRKNITKSYFEGVKYVWGKKVKYIYINKFQYIEILQDNDSAEVNITNFKNELKSPYTHTGVEKIEEGVYHSAVAGFIPFGNHALIQHRTFRSVEAIFGYPRMSEVELPCENCVRGEEPCDPCEEYPLGVKTCSKCHGSGHISLQSPFKIYKRKLFPDAPELNANIKPVEFFTPDIGILQYNESAWKKTLQMGEDAIYIQQRVETGNVESAKSREKQLESMYAWLGRISNVIYHNLQKSLDNYCLINSYSPIIVNKPMSYAIMSELEAFDYLNSIVSTDAPVFIKTTHIENFLNKYISKTSPVIKIVDLLKRVDPFVFYTNKDLQTLSDSGVINDRDWRVHAYAFPLLMQMYTREPQLLEKDYQVVENRLMIELNKRMPVVLNNEVGGSADVSSSANLRGSVGGLTGMIEIAKSVASGLYDLEAAVALVSDRFGLSEEEARAQLGSPQAITNQAQADKISTLV